MHQASHLLTSDDVEPTISDMARTTLDLDDPLLLELKRLQKKEGKTLGRLVSDLLAGVLATRQRHPQPNPFRWLSREMGEPRVSLLDKEGVMAILDIELRSTRRK
jgi:hypothetical protein